MHIKYDFGQIGSTAQDIRTSAATINGQLNELKEVIRPMTATWEGEAATSYMAHQAKWDQAAADQAAVSPSVEEKNIAWLTAERTCSSL